MVHTNAWSTRRIFILYSPPPSTIHTTLSPPPTIYTMPRDATKIRSRETGFEVCNHTCKATCINKGSHSIIWAKEGNSCVRHARRMDLHPGCQDPCPASAGIFVRNTNPGELGEAIKSMLDARWSEATIDAYFAKNIVDWKQGRSNWPPLQVAM